jgi:hypothetical protein
MLVNKSYYSHTFLYTSHISFLKRVSSKKPSASAGANGVDVFLTCGHADCCM